jgi:hypothetical protein
MHAERGVYLHWAQWPARPRNIPFSRSLFCLSCLFGAVCMLLQGMSLSWPMYLARVHTSWELDRQTAMPVAQASALAELHLLSTALLHLGLALALSLWLGDTRGISEAATHARVDVPESVGRVGRNDDHAPPSSVAEHSSEDNAEVGPVGDVPKILGQAGSVEVLAGALDGARGVVGGTGDALELQVDEQLRGREEEVEQQAAAGEGGAVDEGAQQPVEEVDEEGQVEGEIEALGIGGGQRLGGFLGHGGERESERARGGCVCGREAREGERGRGRGRGR